MTIGNSTYIITQVPQSSAPSSSNVHPPPYSCGPLGRNIATSYVHTAVTRSVVSQVHVPPVVLGGDGHTSRCHIPTFGVYVPTYGVSHGTSHVMTYGPYYGTHYGQGSSPYGGGYQQPTYSPNYGFLAPNS